MALVLPPNEVFSQPKAPLVDTQGGHGTYNWIKDVCPEEGGLFAHYASEPYPRKGHVYPEAVEANNVMKRFTRGTVMSIATPLVALPAIGFLLLPWKWKIQWLEKILVNYCELGDYVNRTHYLKRRFYNKFAKEMWDLVYIFLRQLGVSPEVSYRTGRIIGHMFELEDAYRARVQDIFNEVSKEELLKHPWIEISRLTKIYISREKEVMDRMLAFPKIISVLLWHPRLKKAFKETVKHMKMDSLRMDEADRYYVLNRAGYDYLGRPIEDRFGEYQKVHNEYAFQQLTKTLSDPQVIEKVRQQLTTLGLT